MQLLIILNSTTAKYYKYKTLHKLNFNIKFTIYSHKNSENTTEKKNQPRKQTNKHSKKKNKQKNKQTNRDIILPTHHIFPSDFLQVVYLFYIKNLFSKHKSSTLLKLCYLLCAISLGFFL